MGQSKNFIIFGPVGTHGAHQDNKNTITISQLTMQETAVNAVKLSNQVVNGRLENLCFVNSCLNLLFRSTDFSSFFKHKKYLLPDGILENFSISAKLSNLLDLNVKSTANFRRIIAEKSGKFDNCDQQDITAFYSIFFDVLESEFKRNHCNTGLAMLNTLLDPSLGLSYCHSVAY